MPNQLQQHETFADGLKRIAEEQVTAAIKCLQPDEDLHKGIYEARKILKKVRATLRLLEPQLGAIYVEENRRLRDVARRFSNLRDTEVSLELIERLAGQYKRKSTLNPQRQALAERKAALKQTNWQFELAQSVQALAGTLKRIEDWHLPNLNTASLELQLKKTHRQGRHAFKRAGETKTAEDFHELRKSVKLELNQLRLFDTTEDKTPALKELSSLLGDHHNLAVLTATLTNTSGRFRQMTRKHQMQYEAQVLALASRVYAPDQGSIHLSNSSQMRAAAMTP